MQWFSCYCRLLEQSGYSAREIFAEIEMFGRSESKDIKDRDLIPQDICYYQFSFVERAAQINCPLKTEEITILILESSS